MADGFAHEIFGMPPYVHTESTDFKWSSGFSVAQNAATRATPYAFPKNR